MPHRVALALVSSGQVLDVFDELTVSLGLFTPGDAWTYTLWRSGVDFYGNPNPDAADIPAHDRRTAWTVVREIKCGDSVLLSIDDHVVSNGVIEVADFVDNGKTGYALVLSGRDPWGRLMEAHADPRFDGRSLQLEEAIRAAIAPLGLALEVSDAADAVLAQQGRRGTRGLRAAGAARQGRRQRVDTAHPQPGETIAQVVESMVRRAGFMVWLRPSDEAGALTLVLDVPNYDQEPSYRFTRRFTNNVMTPESNIVTNTFRRSIRGVPTSVSAYGRSARNGAPPSRVRVTVENETFARLTADYFSPMPNLPAHLHCKRSHDIDTVTREGRRYMSEKMAQSRRCELTVRGFGQDGRLYAPNTMAHVYDRLPRLDENMLIQHVRFHQSRRDGQVASLELGTDRAIDLAPPADL